MRMIAKFEKSDRVRHIGHLDLMRALHRALRRSGLPIRYSKGFNPHVVMSIASPLSVGVSGDSELMDVSLDDLLSETYFMKMLSPAMPASMPLTGARAVDDSHPKLMAQLKSASYIGTCDDTQAAQALMAAIPAYMAQGSIPAIRRTKSGDKPCDIRPMLHALTATAEDGRVVLAFRASLTEQQTLKPDLLLSSLSEFAGVEVPTVRLHRTGLFGEQGGEAVPLMML